MATKDTAKKEAHAKPAAVAKPVAERSTPISKPVAKRSRKTKVEGAVPHLRIRVRAYEHKILDASLRQIMDTASRYDALIHGPTPLPTEIKKYTVNRSDANPDFGQIGKRH